VFNTQARFRNILRFPWAGLNRLERSALSIRFRTRLFPQESPYISYASIAV